MYIIEKIEGFIPEKSRVNAQIAKALGFRTGLTLAKSAFLWYVYRFLVTLKFEYKEI